MVEIAADNKNKQQEKFAKRVSDVFKVSYLGEQGKKSDLADMYHLNAPLVHMQFDLKDYENR